MNGRSRTTLPCAVLLALLALGAPLTAAAQVSGPDFRNGMRTGIGYTPVVPDVLLGAGAFRFIGNDLGIFGDWKVTVPSRTRHTDYCPPAILECTVRWVEAERNDQVIRDETEWMLFNLGGLYTLSPELAIMLGGGVARRTHVREYFDEAIDPITDTGSYYVRNDPFTDWAPNVVVGALFRAGHRLVFRIGYESAPGGASLGAYLVLGK